MQVNSNNWQGNTFADKIHERTYLKKGYKMIRHDEVCRTLRIKSQAERPHVFFTIGAAAGSDKLRSVQIDEVEAPKDEVDAAEREIGDQLFGDAGDGLDM